MAWKRKVRRDSSPVGFAFEIRWEDASGKERQKTFPIKADPVRDATGRKLKTRPLDKIVEAVERDADRFRIQIELELEKGNSTAALTKTSTTFRMMAEQASAARRSKPKTAAGYELAYRLYIYPTFGERRITSITSMEVEAWLAEMQTKVKPKPKDRPDAPDTRYSDSTVHSAFIALSAAFKYAQKHGLITANPCAVVDKPKVRKVEKDFLEPGEVRAIVRLLDATPPYGLVVLFAAYTGLRPGELAALRVGDINLFRREVRVRRTVQRLKGGWHFDTPKTERANRNVPLGKALVEALTPYLTQHPHATNPEAQLWPGRIPGGGGDVRALNYDRQFDVASLARYYFKPACAQLGLTGVTMHSLRHFYASACAAAGVDIRRVSRYMGHENVNTTDSIYTHLFNGSATDDMDALDAVASRGEHVRPIAALRLQS